MGYQDRAKEVLHIKLTGPYSSKEVLNGCMKIEKINSILKYKKYITFDLNGTLVDNRSSIIKYLISKGKIGFKEAFDLFDLWNINNFKNINSKRISFKDSIVETISPILKRKGLYNHRNIELFIEHYSKAKPFPETSVLKQLKKKYKLVLISNIDNDMVKKNKTGINFYRIITSEDCDYYYKPNKKIFEFALKQLDCTKEDILHVSSSVRADVNGVVPLGWDMVFVNRYNLAVGKNKPLFEVESLSGILNVVNEYYLHKNPKSIKTFK